MESDTNRIQSIEVINTSQVPKASEISTTDRNSTNVDILEVKGQPEISESDDIGKVNVCQKPLQSANQVIYCEENPKNEQPKNTDDITNKTNDSNDKIVDHDGVNLTMCQSNKTDDRKHTDDKSNQRISSNDKEKTGRNFNVDQADKQERNDTYHKNGKAKQNEEDSLDQETDYPLSPTSTKGSPKQYIEQKSSKKCVKKDIEVSTSTKRSNKRSQSYRKHSDGYKKDTTPLLSRKRTRMSLDNQNSPSPYSPRRKELGRIESDNIRVIFTGLEVTARDRHVSYRELSYNVKFISVLVKNCEIFLIFFKCHFELLTIFQMITSIGATLLENIEDAKFATHVIAGNGKKDSTLRRTPKLMICICRTDNILHHDWLIQSSKVKKPLECFPFLLRDENAESKYNFSMLETVKNRHELRQLQTEEFCDDSNCLLLGKYYVCFSKGVAGNKAPPSKELGLIVHAAGGTILRSLSEKSMSNLKEIPHPCNILIVTSDPATSAQMSDKVIMKWNEIGANIVTTTWLFDCIMRQKISFNNYVGTMNKFEKSDDTKSSKKVSFGNYVGTMNKCEKSDDTKSSKKVTKRRTRRSEANDTPNTNRSRAKRRRR